MSDLKRVLKLGNQKHAVFDCHLVIQDIINVPFVSGSFRVKWKFNNAISANTAASTIASVVHTLTPDNTSPESSEASSMASESHSHLHNTLHHFTHTHSKHGSLSSSLSRSQTAASEDIPQSIKQSIDLPQRTGTRDTARPLMRTASSNRTALPEPAPERSRTPEPRGSTDSRHLRDFNVHYNQAVFCPISIPLSKSNILEHSYLKLSVRQSLLEEEKQHESKLGHVTLDLSEYVPEAEEKKKDKGKKEAKKPKRFLLRDGKTNALLRMSIELNWIGGERDYRLAKDEQGHTPSGKSNGKEKKAGSAVSSSASSEHSAPANKPKLRERNQYAHGLTGYSGPAEEESAEQVIDAIFTVAPQAQQESFTRTLRRPQSHSSFSTQSSRAKSRHTPSPERERERDRGSLLSLPPLNTTNAITQPKGDSPVSTKSAPARQLSTESPTKSGPSRQSLSSYSWQPKPQPVRARQSATSFASSTGSKVRWDDRDSEEEDVVETERTPRIDDRNSQFEAFSFGASKG